MSNADSKLAPYRADEETPLEALVRRGPAPRERLPSWLWSLVRVFAVYYAIILAIVAPYFLFPPLVLASPVLLVLLYNRRLRRRHAQAVARMHAYANSAPIAIENIDRWCADGGGLAGVELVFAPLSALAERAIQVTVPEATITREGDRLVVRTTMDLIHRTARLIHLIDTLALHRDELGLVRVVCRRREPRPAIAGPVHL